MTCKTKTSKQRLEAHVLPPGGGPAEGRKVGVVTTLEAARGLLKKHLSPGGTGVAVNAATGDVCGVWVMTHNNRLRRGAASKVATANGPDEVRVSPADGCPTCGERRADFLLWQPDGERVRCASCGRVYEPMGERGGYIDHSEAEEARAKAWNVGVPTYESAGEMVRALRGAGDFLEAMPPDRTTLFPGWGDMDPQHPPVSDERRAVNRSIRRAAAAILNEGTLADECSYVSYRDLGRLVRYLGDMLEG